MRELSFYIYNKIMKLSLFRIILVVLCVCVCFVCLYVNTTVFLISNNNNNTQAREYENLEIILQHHNVTANQVIRDCEINKNKNEKTIILVPYRNRPDHLKLFISPIHEHLMNQVCCVLSFEVYSLC